MCGIAGIFHSDKNKPVDPELLVAMAAIQYHRGPDGFGYKTLEGIGFSHARLSIIDLRETARQPFLSENQNLLLAHNGEFYDYQRIRADLTAKGDRFHTKSDSEIVLSLYPRLGVDKTLEHLRGEFAFSLYDKHIDTMYLVRDRFGIKPLYWTRTPEGIVFGSELKVLFAHPAVKRQFNPEGVYHQLMQTMVPGTTAFEGIHQVKPGYIIEFKRHNGAIDVSEKPYWDINFPLRGERPKGEDILKEEHYWIDRTRDELLEAVQLRLEADVPVGCYLSGGIDSCAILGLAAAARQNPVKAFTIGFDNASYDESSIAEEMAESVGADQDILRLNSDHLYDHFVETHYHTERTVYNTLAVAKYLMSQHVHSVGYKVVMTGEGSDELFSGYPSFRRDMFLHGLDDLPDHEKAEWEEMLRESNQIFRGAMLAEDAVHNEHLEDIFGFTPSCLQPWLATAPRIPQLLSKDFRHHLKDYDPGEAIAATFHKDMIKGRHPLDQAQYAWIKTMLEGQILTWGGDRVDMANSMEARPAFLDHHLAETVAHIPPGLRIKGRTEKYVLREAMKGLLPRVLYEREKFAFMAPPAHTDEKKYKAMKDLADDFLSDDYVKKSGLLDTEGIKNLFTLHDHPETEASTMIQLDAILNHLIGVQVLYRHFVEADVPALAKKKAEELGWHP